MPIQKGLIQWGHFDIVSIIIVLCIRIRSAYNFVNAHNDHREICQNFEMNSKNKKVFHIVLNEVYIKCHNIYLISLIKYKSYLKFKISLINDVRTLF